MHVVYKVFMNTPSTTVNLLRLESVMHQTGHSRSLIYKKIGEGTFPKQVKISGKSVRWLSNEIDDFVASLANARDTVH